MYKRPSQPDEYDKPIYLERYLDLVKISFNWVHGDLYNELTTDIHEFDNELFDEIHKIKRLYRVGLKDKDFKKALQEYIDEQIEKGVAISKEDKIKEYYTSLLNIDFNSKERRNIKELLLDFSEYDFNHNPLSNYYFKAAKEGKLKEIALRFKKFNNYMHSMGLFYYPTGTCPQCGDHEGVQKVLKTALEILEKEISKFDN